jgi:hypothetical protein
MIKVSAIADVANNSANRQRLADRTIFFIINPFITGAVNDCLLQQKKCASWNKDRVRPKSTTGLFRSEEERENTGSSSSRPEVYSTSISE